MSAPEPSNVLEPESASPMDITAEPAVNTADTPPNDQAADDAVDDGGLTNDEVDGPNTHGTGGLLPASFWRHLQDQQEEREAADDNDSALGDNASYTDTVTSSILDYEQLHGRTYHSRSFEGAQYWGSNDEKQVEALDINHLFLTKLFDNKLHFAPIDDNIQRVLDVGTGSGKWAIEFADSHEGVEVTGTDLSPTMQPQWVPTNLKFEIEDCTADWTFTPASFDFIHMRYLVGSIQNWTELFRQAYAATKPGGWVESIEGSPHMRAEDGSVSNRSAISQWGKFFEEGGAKMGRSFLVVDEGTQRRAMEQVGFINIGEREFKAPVGGWPEDEAKRTIGQLSQAALEHDIEGYVLFIANVLAEWGREEILVYIAQLRREIRSGKHHASFRVKSVWGRRPF